MTDSPLTLIQVDVSKLWTTVASIVIAFSFIFGTSIRQMYESVIFLFVVHPFDVGDALIVLADYHVVSDAGPGHPPCRSIHLTGAEPCLCWPAEHFWDALRFRLVHGALAGAVPTCWQPCGGSHGFVEVLMATRLSQWS